MRLGRRWFNLLWLLPLGFFTALAAAAVAQGLRQTETVTSFINRFPGTALAPAAEGANGLPAWRCAQHFVDLFLMIFIIRSGLQILSDHPRSYWTRHSTPGRD